VQAAIAKFTLIERPKSGVEIPDPESVPPPPRNPGDQLLIIDRVLEDKNGNQRGTFVFRGGDH
jgi:hypothetical protein